MSLGQSPGEGKYARIEREQRWVLPCVPEGALLRAEIVDRYFIGTSLRLRSVTSETNRTLKLTQKVPVHEAGPEFVKSTNIYLTPDEYEMFAALPAAVILKDRWERREAQSLFAVDRFLGRHDGLVLAEIELDRDAERVAGPSSAVAEVTDDIRFSGGFLAAVSPDGLAHLLTEFFGGTGVNE